MEIKAKFKKLYWNTSLLFCRFLGRKYQAKCGHKTKLIAEVKIFGEKTIFWLNKKNIKYCQQCLVDMSIKCSWCGKSITVRDPVTLCTPMKKDFQMPEWAVIYKKVPLQLVGCLRWECAESGVDRAGFWIAPGKVHRVLSPLEMLIAYSSENPIICNNLENIKNAISYPSENQ